MLQSSYSRAQQISSHVYVVTDVSHAHHVQEQLTELPADALLIEPARRGTASCILAALAYISKRHKDDESIAFIAADHYIRDVEGFKYSFKIADSTTRSEGRIVLVGVEPDHPSTGFGYIRKGKLLNDSVFVFNVESFHEKPDFKTAQKFLRSGKYLWNCSYFIGTLSSFLAEMREHAPALLDGYERLAGAEGEDFKEQYLQLENIAIDYALIEKLDNLLVVPAAFDWMDLGSYNDLAKAVSADERGNHSNGAAIHIEEVQNTYIENHESKPIVVIGLDNCVVVNTPHGILVTRKDLSQKVGEVSKRINQS